MNWLNKLFEKDEFLEELQNYPDSYQSFFVKLTDVADEKVWAKFMLNPKFALSEEGVKQIEKEEIKTFPILEEATKCGLNQVVLLVAYLQYATADPLFDQGAKKTYWISIIRNRKPTDSFPHHYSIANYLEQYGYI
jgi:hypothetical protein